MSILSFSNLSYSYDKKKNIFSNISAEMELGKIYAILGPSGCGKTTLLSLLGGLDSPTKGKILFNGEDITEKGLGLTKEEMKRNVLQLSGGQQQRVAIARALASEAPVILADEPTGNLDEETAMSIMQILEDSVHQMNKCAVIVTHSNEIAKKADVVFQLKRGTLHIVKNNEKV